MAFNAEQGSEESLKRLIRFLGGESKHYEAIRTRLCSFFRWKGCPDAENLADTTLNRVAWKLEQGEKIESKPVAYVLGVARFVFLEDAKRGVRARAGLQEQASNAQAADPEHDACMQALTHCLESLGAIDQARVLRYHQGQGQEKITARKAIALSEGVPLARLRIQMHRLRARLEKCVRGQLS